MDGRYLLYSTFHPAERDADLWGFPLEEDGKAEVFLQTQFVETNARFSPDGRWVAYQSDESGHPEIYVRTFPGPGGKMQFSAGGGRQPRWSGDGRHLLFLQGAQLHEVEVSTENNALQVEKPRPIVESPNMMRSSWSLAPDGNQFVFIQD